MSALTSANSTRPSTPSTSGSMTVTATNTATHQGPVAPAGFQLPPVGRTLHLRGEPGHRPTRLANSTSVEGESEEDSDRSGTRTRGRIHWAEDVVDNEGMGKKSSKVCCIYHAPRAVGESSDEDDSSSSSSSDSDSDSEPDTSRAQPARRSRDHAHDHGSGKGKGKGRAPSPNAYEKMPKYRPRDKAQQA